jgi:GNAT superfamily N-acetyltransferase
MSLYADYLFEHHNDRIIETFDSFIVYRYLNDKQVYIVDLYVVPEKRVRGMATELALEVEEIAKTQGIHEVIGTVVPSAKNATTSLKILLHYGMSLKSASENLIVFTKAI